MSKPDFRAYTVIKREGKEDFWLNIGTGFKHGDDGGISILLQALPLDAKIVLRVFKENEQEQKTEIEKGKKWKK